RREMVTHEGARADDLDGSMTGEPHDLERQEVLAVVRHHEAGTPFEGTREHRVVSRVTRDESHVVASRNHGSQVPKNGHEGVDLNDAVPGRAGHWLRAALPLRADDDRGEGALGLGRVLAPAAREPAGGGVPRAAGQAGGDGAVARGQRGAGARWSLTSAEVSTAGAVSGRAPRRRARAPRPGPAPDA